jgi:hypothetical protein
MQENVAPFKVVQGVPIEKNDLWALCRNNTADGQPAHFCVTPKADVFNADGKIRVGGPLTKKLSNEKRRKEFLKRVKSEESTEPIPEGLFYLLRR